MGAILHVKNLTPWLATMNRDTLQEAFEVYGHIRDITCRNGKIRYAFIHFESMENAEEARSHLDGKPLYGAYLKVTHFTSSSATIPVQDVNLQSPARATTKGWKVDAVSIRDSSQQLCLVCATSTAWKVSPIRYGGGGAGEDMSG